MKTEKSKYGEPWEEVGDYGAINSLDGAPILEYFDYGGLSWTKDPVARAIQCVNACDGIEDPAAALEEAREVIGNFHEYLNIIGHTATAREVAKTLAKLSPKP